MKAFRNLRLIGTALLLLALIGMAGFHFIEGWTWFDGLYMVVTTFTTIGYQEIHPLSHAGRFFNLALIVSGVSLVFLGIGVAHAGFARIRAGQLLRKAKNGARNQSPQRSLHHLRRRARWPQCGARIGTPSGSVSHHRAERGEGCAL